MVQSKRLRNLIMDNTRVMKRGFLWNSMASIITAISSICVLLIITRFVGKDAGANLSIAVAIVNVLMNIGHMNIMGYQISDIKEKYVFNTYLKQRCYSVTVMILIAFFYSYVKYGISEKMIIVCLYNTYKAVNVFCEVYQSRYQQRGRVDIASELNFIKVLLPDVTLCIVSMIYQSLLVGIIGAIIIEILTIYLFNCLVWKGFSDSKESENTKVFNLTKEAFPLFISAFATAYILNSAKYAIDNNMSAQYQLLYTVLLLPATTVHMIAGFVYRPILTLFANIWSEKKHKELIKKVLVIVGIILLCTFGIILIRDFILSILAWAYALAELKQYSFAFGILLMAGGANALNVFFCYLITIIRKQKYLYIINGITLGVSLVLPELLVNRNGINGAALSYLLIMIIQICGFIFSFVLSVIKEKNRGEI